MATYYIYNIVHYIFLAYTLLLTVRILASWVHSWRDKTWFRFVAFYTDPYLRIFQRIIPPIGGIDLSPLLAFFGLRILESLILAILR
jgi:YggT family protein